MMNSKLAPWFISHAVKVAIAPAVASLSFWETYWRTFASVKWPQGAK